MNALANGVLCAELLFRQRFADDHDRGGASHVVFVIRDDESRADLLFQTSDTTWQAYNTYGGTSLYVGGPGTSPSRAYAVSYNRPVTTRATSPRDWLFNAEYPMVRWLEANGCSDTSAAAEPAPCVEYSGCSSGLPVRWCVYDDGHDWPEFGPEGIWGFFSGL